MLASSTSVRPGRPTLVRLINAPMIQRFRVPAHPLAKSHGVLFTTLWICAENLLYMPRLGLWGEGTAFPSKMHFVTELKQRGVGAHMLPCIQKPARQTFAPALSTHHRVCPASRGFHPACLRPAPFSPCSSAANLCSIDRICFAG